MTAEEKVKRIQEVEADFFRKLDELKKNYRTKVKVIKDRIQSRKIAELKEDLYR